MRPGIYHTTLLGPGRMQFLAACIGTSLLFRLVSRFFRTSGHCMITVSRSAGGVDPFLHPLQVFKDCLPLSPDSAGRRRHIALRKPLPRRDSQKHSNLFGRREPVRFKRGRHQVSGDHRSNPERKGKESDSEKGVGHFKMAA